MTFHAFTRSVCWWFVEHIVDELQIKSERNHSTQWSRFGIQNPYLLRTGYFWWSLSHCWFHFETFLLFWLVFSDPWSFCLPLWYLLALLEVIAMLHILTILNNKTNTKHFNTTRHLYKSHRHSDIITQTSSRKLHLDTLPFNSHRHAIEAPEGTKTTYRSAPIDT